MSGLKLKGYSDLWKLVDEIKKPFRQRDVKWKRRRDIRYRRLEAELIQLPLNPRVSDQALMVQQDESPNQEVHKRVKRLVANKPRFEVITYDDDPAAQRLAQDTEDGVRALYEWQARGKTPFDWKLTQFQQGDGLGIAKETFVPGHGDVLSSYEKDKVGEPPEEESAESSAVEKAEIKASNTAKSAYSAALTKHKGNTEKAYAQVTDDILRKELPPFRFTAVDPLSCYWWEDDDGIEVICEVGYKTLNPLLAAFADYGLRYDKTKSRFYEDKTGSDVAGSSTSPILSYGNTSTTGWGAPATGDLSTRVKYMEIRTRDEIAILFEHPKLKEKQPADTEDDRGIALHFDNPFGPYTTGYVLVPGDVTTEDAEEDKYQPTILASLNAAPALNVLATAELSAALEAALSPPYVKVTPEQNLSPTEEDKTITEGGGEIPVIPGELKRMESPAVQLEKIADRIIAEKRPYDFQDSLAGGAMGDVSGHRLAIQVAQADIQMVPYQNARQAAIKELMMGALYAIRQHGLTIYIPTLPNTVSTGSKVRVADQAYLSPEMADLNFELLITLGSETPVTKYAKWEALKIREESGTIGYQTVIEQSDVENPMDEMKRVFEGKMLKAVMEQTIPDLANEVATAVRRRLQDFLKPPQEQIPPQEPVQGQLPMGIPPETGMAGGGGGPPTMQPRVPGVSMPVTPTTPSIDTGVSGVPAGGGEVQVQ